MYSSFQEDLFRRQVDKALISVNNVLDITRNPRYAEEEDHAYENKFDLANLQVNTAIAAQINILQKLGLNEGKLRQLCDFVHKDKKNITLRFAARDECNFVKEQDVDVITHESEYQVEETKTKAGVFGKSTKTKNYNTKVKTKIKEYHWKITTFYKLFVYCGNDPNSNENIIELQHSPGKSTIIITTGSRKSPIDAKTTHNPIDVSLTWLVQNLSIDQHVCKFKIDRSDPEKCRTPRRNDQVDEAATFFQSMKVWSLTCKRYFINKIQNRILDRHNPAQVDKAITTVQDLNQATQKSDNIFVPVLPLFENSVHKESSKKGTDTHHEDPKSMLAMCPPCDNNDVGASPLLSSGDIDRFLNEQLRTIDVTISDLSSTYPEAITTNKIVTVHEAKIVMLFQHNSNLIDQTVGCMNYIEHMLRTQLIAAIGKEVQPKDFDEFIRFHNQTLLGPDFRPKPFCHAIRRPNHYPDGILSIENTNNDGKLEPAETITRAIPGSALPPLFVPINAATAVEFTGDRFLHGWIQHQFESSSRHNDNKFQLAARARQFSSFILLVGTICGPNKFDPKDAIIIQNKDEVIVPLLLNTLPTAKEFKDAIESLSPEQQRFARSFRNMQLESSVFGVCVVQLKPQLEALLGLPPDSLTKEIGLTQDLLSLFIDYQIPSDLLSFDGTADTTSTSDKVNAVKGYVKSVQDVINNEKEKQIEEATKEADMRVESNREWPGPTGPRVRSAFLEPEIMGCAAEIMDDICIDACAAPPSSRGFYRASKSKAIPFGVPATAQPPASLMSDVPDCGLVGRSNVAGRIESQGAPATAEPPIPRSREVRSAVESRIESLGASKMKTAGKSQQQQASPEFRIWQQQTTQQQTTQQDSSNGVQSMTTGHSDLSTVNAPVGIEAMDFTCIPKQLDIMFEKHDSDSALRSTIVKASSTGWSRTRQQNLLTKPTKCILTNSELKTEKEKAFDLLDALSRSGSLPISCGELHVIVAVTHCFENSLMGSVIEDNINPIEKVERTTLMIASTIHATPNTQDLVKGSAHASRLVKNFPALFDSNNEEENALMPTSDE